jgi:Family of unknown function (DUF5683)
MNRTIAPIRRLAVGLALFLATSAAAAQNVADSVAGRAIREDTLAVRPLSPRGAMIRSFILPGWGQSAVGSYVRGGVWYSIEGTNLYMLLRTIGRYTGIRDIERRAVAIVTDSLNDFIARNTDPQMRSVRGFPILAADPQDSAEAVRLQDPIAFENAIAADTSVAIARKLVRARRQQRQDWITYTIFFTLLSGVDAYVNAQLRDFPTTILSEVRRDGSVAISLTFPLPGLLGGTRSHPPRSEARGSPWHQW